MVAMEKGEKDFKVDVEENEEEKDVALNAADMIHVHPLCRWLKTRSTFILPVLE